MKAQKNRKRAREKTRAAFFTEEPRHIPHEMVHEILLRLPANSLLRFKAVCKSWRALISGPQFVKQHLDVANKTMHNVNYLHLYDVNCIRSSSSNHEFLYLTSINSHASEIKTVKFEYSSCYQTNDMKLVGSCNGMLLMRTPEVTLLWNPLTKEHRLFQPIPDCNYYYPLRNNQGNTSISGLGYDSSLDEYKAVIFEKSKFSMFLLTTKSYRWKEVVYRHGFPYDTSHRDCLGLTVNGVPNFLVTEYREGHVAIEAKIIIYFDFVEEKFKRVPMPVLPSSSNGRCEVDMAVLGGCLCIVHYDDVNRNVEVWTMNNYGVKESWTKLFVRQGLVCDLMPFGFTKKGEVLMKIDMNQIVTYNLNKKKEDSSILIAIKNDFRFNAAAAYVESLVSLGNKYKKKKHVRGNVWNEMANTTN